MKAKVTEDTAFLEQSVLNSFQEKTEIVLSISGINLRLINHS
jgi:hypothetical protein